LCQLGRGDAMLPSEDEGSRRISIFLLKKGVMHPRGFLVKLQYLILVLTRKKPLFNLKDTNKKQ
jgi:hypothetical protein